MKNPDKPVLFLLCGKRKNQQSVQIFDHIPLIDVINWTQKDKDGNMVTVERKIRYISGATSIFADEQPDYYDVEWEKKNMRPKSLRIANGQLEVLPTQILLMKFLKLCNYNASNPSRRKDANPLIEEFNPEAISKANNLKRDLRITAENTVKNMDINQLRAHLVTMSTDGTLTSINRFRNMEEEQLRDIAYLEAGRNASGFMASFQNPATKNKYIIINAVLRTIISFNEQSNTIAWSNGEVIMTSANGMNAVDALAEIAINSPQHKAIIDDLFERMADRMGSAEKLATKPEDRPIEAIKDMYDTLIDSCIKASIMSENFPWFAINKVKDAPADEPVQKFHGKNKLKEALKADGKKLYMDLMERLERSTVTA